jgi:hypothetical protein
MNSYNYDTGNVITNYKTTFMKNSLLEKPSVQLLSLLSDSGSVNINSDVKT